MKRSLRILQLALSCSLLAVVGSCVNPKSDTEPKTTVPPSFEAAVTDYNRGSFETAVSMLKELSTSHPEDVRSRVELVRLYEETGNYEGAIKTLLNLHNIEKRLSGSGRTAADPGKIERQLFITRVLAGRSSQAEAMLPLSQADYHTIFYEALLAMNLGHTAKASLLFRRTLAMHRHQPIAWYFLGKLALSDGRYLAAEEDFQTVLVQDKDLTIAIPGLARAILAQGREKEAYPLLLRAKNILPGNSTIRRELAGLETKSPDLAKAHTTQSELRQRDAVAPRVESYPAAAVAPYIRVGLAEDLRALTIKTGGSYRIRSLSPDGTLSYKGQGGRLLELKNDDSAVTLATTGKPPFLAWTGPVILTYMDPGNTTMIFNLVTDAGSFYATTGNRAYRGAMIFIPGQKGFTVVNRIPLEEYLYSVLPSEMYAFWPIAALRAQAVAARSYTLASMGSFASKGFDVYGSVLSAAYLGVGNESPRTTEAVNATRGQILKYDGNPMKAFYSANSGGYTETSKVVWGDSHGMRAVPDLLEKKRAQFLSLTQLGGWIESDPTSYSATPPYFSPSAYRWVKWVPAEEISMRANKIKPIGEVRSMVTRGRGISGRVAKIELFGTDGALTLQGDRVRSVLGNLRSSLFVYRPKLGMNGLPEYFIFSGAGWGHGVGMDQDGAAGMASSGYTYQQILAHYYPLGRLVDDTTGSAIAPNVEAGQNQAEKHVGG